MLKKIYFARVGLANFLYQGKPAISRVFWYLFSELSKFNSHHL